MLKAHPESDNSHILLRREGESGVVRVYLNEVRYLADAMLDMAAQIAGHAVGAIGDLRSTARGLAAEVGRTNPDPDVHEVYQGYAQRYERILGNMLPVWES